jgi:hypothetical protein
MKMLRRESRVQNQEYRKWSRSREHRQNSICSKRISSTFKFFSLYAQTFNHYHRIVCVRHGTGSVFAQEFFKDYKSFLVANYLGKAPQSLDLVVKNMKSALASFEKQTAVSMLNSDTLFMVHYYIIESGEIINVIWNRTNSMSYHYRFHKPITVTTDASDYIKYYLADFKKWVETADTLSYSKYGKQSSWFDAPLISFTVATKTGNRWHFIRSNTYSNNVDRF